MNKNEMTKYIRDYLKVMEIPCRVKQSVSCGRNHITVKPVNVDYEFSAYYSHTIKTLALGLGLTHVEGLKIIVENYNSGAHVFEVASCI